MKPILSLLLFLCLFCCATAQQKNIAQPQSAALRPGDPVPDMLITGLSGYNENGRQLKQIRLSHLRGKLLILDFWATWCAPCRAIVPHLDSLQKTFGSRVQILPVTYQKEATVKPVLAAMRKQHPFGLPEVTGDQALHRLFPHQSLPHFAWISPDGTVLAITDEKAVTAENINAFLRHQLPVLALKQDARQSYDPQRPLLINQNGGAGQRLLYHSLLTGFIPGLPGGLQISPFDSLRGQHFNVRNVPLLWLYRLAFSQDNQWFSDARVRTLTRDSARMNSQLSGRAYDQWLDAGNGYCYELLVPPQLASQAFPMIRADLERLFPRYQAAVERHRTPALVLVRTSGQDKLRSAGSSTLVEVSPFGCHLRNAPLKALLQRLDQQYLQQLDVPLTDETGYTGRVDLDLDTPMTDIDSLNRALARYDLRLVRQTAELNLLVIRDALPDHSSAKGNPGPNHPKT